MRAYSGTMLMLGGMAAVLALNSPLPGADPKAKDDAVDSAAANDDGGAKKKEKPAGGKDPVTAAFALPKGTTLIPKQQAAYDDLKQKYEEQLRLAFDDVQHADGAAATSRGLKEIRETKAKIRDGIQDILAMPYREAAEKTNPQSGSSSGAPSSGGYYPNAYPNGYPGGYPGYYPGGYPGYYPGYYPPYRSSSTRPSTGSNSTPARSQSPPKPPSKPAPPPPPKH